MAKLEHAKLLAKINRKKEENRVIKVNIINIMFHYSIYVHCTFLNETIIIREYFLFLCHCSSTKVFSIDLTLIFLLSIFFSPESFKDKVIQRKVYFDLLLLFLYFLGIS